MGCRHLRVRARLEFGRLRQWSDGLALRRTVNGNKEDYFWTFLFKLVKRKQCYQQQQQQQREHKIHDVCGAKAEVRETIQICISINRKNRIASSTSKQCSVSVCVCACILSATVKKKKPKKAHKRWRHLKITQDRASSLAFGFVTPLREREIIAREWEQLAWACVCAPLGTVLYKLFQHAEDDPTRIEANLLWLWQFLLTKFSYMF